MNIGDKVQIIDPGWIKWLKKDPSVNRKIPLILEGVIDKIGTNRGSHRLRVRFPVGPHLCFDPSEIQIIE